MVGQPHFSRTRLFFSIPPNTTFDHNSPECPCHRLFAKSQFFQPLNFLNHSDSFPRSCHAELLSEEFTAMKPIRKTGSRGCLSRYSFVVQRFEIGGISLGEIFQFNHLALVLEGKTFKDRFWRRTQSRTQPDVLKHEICKQLINGIKIA